MRNPNLDFAKAIACMGVVIMHCSFPGVFGKFALYLFKFAVPLFFMVSGYFLFRPELDRRAKLQNQTKGSSHIVVTDFCRMFVGGVFRSKSMDGLGEL